MTTPAEKLDSTKRILPGFAGSTDPAKGYSTG